MNHFKCAFAVFLFTNLLWASTSIPTGGFKQTGDVLNSFDTYQGTFDELQHFNFITSEEKTEVIQFLKKSKLDLNKKPITVKIDSDRILIGNFRLTIRDSKTVKTVGGDVLNLTRHSSFDEFFKDIFLKMSHPAGRSALIFFESAANAESASLEEIATAATWGAIYHARSAFMTGTGFAIDVGANGLGGALESMRSGLRNLSRGNVKCVDGCYQVDMGWMNQGKREYNETFQDVIAFCKQKKESGDPESWKCGYSPGVMGGMEAGVDLLFSTLNDNGRSECVHDDYLEKNKEIWMSDKVPPCDKKSAGLLQDLIRRDASSYLSSTWKAYDRYGAPPSEGDKTRVDK